MHISVKCTIAGSALLLAASLVACGKPAPAETAGQKIDVTVEEAGATSGETAEKMLQRGDRAAEAISDAEITAKVKAAIFLPNQV